MAIIEVTVLATYISELFFTLGFVCMFLQFLVVT
jgi:hypothetical protein